MKSALASMTSQGRAGHVVQRGELTGFGTTFRWALPGVAPGQQRGSVDDHVHLVRARFHGRRDIGQLDRQRAPRTGTRWRPRRPRRPNQPAPGGPPRPGPSPCRLPRPARPPGQWGMAGGPGAQPGDFVRRVGPFERGQVHYPHGGVRWSQFGGAFDGPGCRRGGSLLDPHLIHPRQPMRQLPQLRISDPAARLPRRAPPRPQPPSRWSWSSALGTARISGNDLAAFSSMRRCFSVAAPPWPPRAQRRDRGDGEGEAAQRRRPPQPDP